MDVHASRLGRNPVLAISVGLFISISLVLLLIPPAWFPQWFFPRATASGGFLYAFWLVLINIVFPIPKNICPTVAQRKYKARRRLQNYAAVCCVLGFSGTLGLFELPIPFDKFNHFAVAFLITSSVSLFFYAWYNLPITQCLIIAVGIMIIADIGWEVGEFLSDVKFGTQAFGTHGQNTFSDTAWDGVFDVLGIICAILAVRLRKRPWPIGDGLLTKSDNP
jgi:hypothetical protein